MTILFADPLFQRHDTGRHAEQPARLVVIQNRLENAGLVASCKRGTYQPLTPEDVCEIHAPEVVAGARKLAEAGGGWLEADTFVCPASYHVALAAAGACVAGVDQVLRGVDRSALCLVRPPGHHATPSHSMGFCLFNNVALAAQHARKAFGLDRILIVDWDVHHGNGTQDIFWADPTVSFLSIHRYGHGFYPGTGAVDEMGTGAGLGCTTNVPVRFGTPRPDYRALFRNAVEKAADRIKPDLVIFSAGFDAHQRDPIGSLGLETEDFADMTKTLLAIADTHAQGRLVSCLEGGYHLEALAESVQAHLEELLHEREGLKSPYPSEPRTQQAVREDRLLRARLGNHSFSDFIAMTDLNPPTITLAMMRQAFYSAVVCDALDAAGYPHQSPRVPLKPLTVNQVLIGRCKTTLWADMAHADPRPYELELAAVDGCQRDDVLIAAAGGSPRSGIWGELLTTAARNQGCVGAIVDGMVRDVTKMRALQFPVFARGTCIYDSKDRQRVIDLDVPVEIDGVRFCPGDLIVADEDGIVVVPQAIEETVVRKAWEKIHAENQVRDAIQTGMKAADVFRKFGVL